MDINATLIAQAIVFTAFVAICWKFIYPPMLSMMHEREQRIAEGLEAAKKADDSFASAANYIKKIGWYKANCTN